MAETPTGKPSRLRQVTPALHCKRRRSYPPDKANGVAAWFGLDLAKAAGMAGQPASPVRPSAIRQEASANG